jgi:hypothetical protein
MLYFIAAIVVLAIAYVSYKQGEFSGQKDGWKVGYIEGQIAERLEAEWRARESVLSNLRDEQWDSEIEELFLSDLEELFLEEQ